MSAQVLAGRQPLRRSVGSFAAEAVSQHPSLRETLALFGLPASITIRQLYNLLTALDHECLRQATANDSTSDVDSVAGLAMRLSEPLSQCSYPGTFLFMELQLRALISSMALLQHNGVRSLDPDFYDQLRSKNISARFQKIAFGLQRSSTLEERIRQSTSCYLVQLASQYASFTKRGDSPWPSIFRPLANIFFAALSLGGGQYDHIRDIIGGVKGLVQIWQKPQTKYLALCSIQECNRLVGSLCRESAIEDESSELRKAVAGIVTSLIDQVETLVAENGGFPSELARRWHKALAFVSHGPPNIDKGYFFWGLLDCLSQLAALSEPQALGEGLLNKLKGLVFDSVVPEYRWKAIEILLSCHCTRSAMFRDLDRDIRGRVTVETEAKILEEMRFIKAYLDSDEEEGLRFQVSRPLTRVSSARTSTMLPELGGPSLEEIDASTPESVLSRSLTKTSTIYSLKAVHRSSGTYLGAGVFDDCRHAYLNNDVELSVYKLGDLRKKPISPSFPRVFNKRYKHREWIRSVASSRSGIVIATNKSLLVYNIEVDTPIDISPHGEWDPSGLACHETATLHIVFLGKSQRNGSMKFNGQIQVHRYRKDGHAERLPVFALNVHANDCPKRLLFDADSRILTCITRTQNKLLMWKLDDEFFSSSEPFEFWKNNYTAEMWETGVTSASIYRSPSGQPYVLCVTAPSSERWHHDGEWSFILPFPPQSQTHLGNRVYAFEQFKDHGPLFVGCASSQHHIFAVVEDSGRLSILRLDKHSDGGIHGGDEVEILTHSLCKQDRPSANCLRFDPSGSYLFAIDPKGKIIVTEFEKE